SSSSLLGVLPIPLLTLLLGVLGYLLSGFFLGHLSRDAVQSVQMELESRARSRLNAFTAARTPPATEDSEIVFGYYRNGRRVAGDRRTPAVWPGWTEASAPLAHGPRWGVVPLNVTLAGSQPTL